MLFSVSQIYEIGHVHFMGVECMVAPGAFVPREETELLGLAALQAITEQHTASPRVIDLCCGSGNLACAIASRLPRAKVWASDLTDRCVDLARRNARRLGLEAQVSVHQGDLFQGLRGMGLEGTVDVVVCNPPYIPERRLQGDRAHLLEHESREAFDGGPYGFRIHQRGQREAAEFLRPGGVLLFEIGEGQHGQMETLFRRGQLYDDIRLLAVASSAIRVVRGQRR